MEQNRLAFDTYRVFWSRVAGVFAIAYLLFIPPPAQLGHTLLDMGEILGFFLLVVAALGRLWCLSFIAGAKNALLITEGPYSVVRNPLYCFSFVGAVGLGLAVENPPLALLAACAFLLSYPGLVRREEARLKQRFGNDYVDYCAATPRWIPNWSAYREPESWVISPRHFRRGLLDAMWFIWLFMLWEIIEEFPILGSLRIAL